MDRATCIAQMFDGVDAKIAWHFCFGNAWGNDILSGNFPQGYETVLPYFCDVPGIDEFVLDFANRDMVGVEFLKSCPKDKGVAGRRGRRPHQHGRDARGDRRPRSAR